MNKIKIFLTQTVFLSLLIILTLSFPSLTKAATGDISGIRIRDDGWSADIDISGFTSTSTSINMGFGADNDPTNAKVIFNVISPGFGADGRATNVTRTIYGTKVVRLPFPKNNVLDEKINGDVVTLRVSLSDFIYTADTAITASIANNWFTDNGRGGTGLTNNTATNVPVTNNSLQAYPKSIGRWAWPGYERVTGDFLVEAVAFNRFARNGKPVAAVVFSATDQHGNTAYATTTDLTRSTRNGDANAVFVYAATLSANSFVQGDFINVDFKVYPWVGDSTTVLDSSPAADGVIQPSELLGSLIFVNDKNQTYGAAFAYVSGITGSDSTGVVYSSQPAAENGKAYRTIEKAAEAIRAFNSKNYSRNEAGGGTILLAEGNYQYPGASSVDLGIINTWLTIKPASNALRANTIINANPIVTSFRSNKTKIEGLTIASNSSNLIGGRSATDVLWLHNNIINTSGSSTFTSQRVAYATQNQVESLPQGFSAFGGSIPFALIRGNTATSPTKSSFYTVLGNKNITATQYAEYNSGRGAVADNAIYAYNSVYNMSSTSLDWATVSKISKGIAIIQNVIEAENSLNFPLLEVGATSNPATTTDNILIWNNTLEGQRTNVAYLLNGNENSRKYNWSIKYNIFNEWNIKTDTFTSGTGGANGGRVGNWPVVYNVGALGNISEQYNFPGEWNGLSTKWSAHSSQFLHTGFTNDASKYGSGLGNGDYTLKADSMAIDLAKSQDTTDQVMPFDFIGNPRYGPSDTGAYEYQPAFVMGQDLLQASSTIRLYGDNKFRYLTTSSSTKLANLNISIPGNNRAQWSDINIIAWPDSPAEKKSWNESRSITGSTYTVGDLIPLTPYSVNLDGQIDQSITGNICAAGICTTDENGKIIFIFNGTSGPHLFEIQKAGSSTPPTIKLSVSSPISNSIVRGVVPVEVTATTTNQISSLTIYIDGTLVESTFTPEGHVVNFDSTLVNSGPHQMIVVGKYNENNFATSTAVEFTINNTDIGQITASSTSTSTETLSANTISTGNANLTSRGFVYSIATNNSTTTYSTTTESGDFGNGTFSANIDGLTCKTTYNFKAYGVNAGGLTYSNEASFETTECPVVPTDSNPPTISNGNPIEILPATTTSIILSVTTDEDATCRYGTIPNTEYDQLSSAFSQTGSTSHQVTLNDLVASSTNNYYVRCSDQLGNKNLNDYLISFTIASSTENPLPSPTPSIEPTPTPTPEASSTPSPTPDPTIEPTPTPTSEPTPTPSENPTPSPTPDPTIEPTPSPTVDPTPSASPTPDPTVEPTPTPTVDPSPTPTPEISPTPSPVPTPIPTIEPTPTPTPSIEPTPVPTPVPTPTPTPEITQGLLDRWDFNEGQGNITVDPIGNNTGILLGTNAPQWITGHSGSNAVSFDGIDNYVNIPNLSALNGATSTTISFWINPSVQNTGIINRWGSGRFLVVNNSSTGALHTIWRYGGSGGSGSSLDITTPGSTIKTNIWQHIVLIYNNPTASIYVNGVLKATVTGNGGALNTNVNDSLKLGYASSSAKPYLNGAIDDFRIYNRALSNSEIQQLYTTNQ